MTAEDQKIEELIFMMRRVGLDLSLRLEQELRHGDLSGVQVYLMVYLLRHHRDGTYLTEICKEKNMQNAIKLIEQDGNTVENIIRVQV